ncbi:MAG: cupredoxin domain-containing protein [Nitrososphaerota archaeon]|nr:cupredoxin domain-containing protein [Nitrososphaerota archaeon]
MIGYLVVLPNAAYNPSATTTTATNSAASATVAVSIVSGAGVPYSGYASGSTSVFGFSPGNLTVVIGVNNTVTWTNNDITIHTVTANNGAFNSGYLNTGQTFTYTFTSPGVYEYHCQIHPWMVGYVTVLAG